MTTTAEHVGTNPRAALTGRETRQFTVQAVELRQDDSGGTTGLVGYASVAGVPYTVNDFLGEYQETIRAGAFNRTLQHKDDVRLLLNHAGLPLARTKSGTLTLTEITDPADDPQKRGQTGLWVSADLDPRSSLATDVKLAMERGDLDEMSFAFQSVKEEWSTDYSQRDILEVKLFDVSVVTYPANPATSVGLRNVEVDQLSESDAADLMGRLQARLAHQAPADVRDLSLAAAQAMALRSRRGLAATSTRSRVSLVNTVTHHLRAGRALAADDLSALADVLASLADADAGIDAADVALDDALAQLSTMLGVPNPDPADVADAPTA